MKLKLTSNNKGFTLIELIISIFVIGALAGITLVNFRAAERSKKVQFASDTLINAIRTTQNNTLTSKQISNSSCDPDGAGIGAVDRASQFYVLVFATASSQQLYGIDKCNNWVLTETFNSPIGTQVRTNGITVDGDVITGLKIKFTPPFGAISFADTISVPDTEFETFENISIIFETIGGATSKTISVDGISGKVE